MPQRFHFGDLGGTQLEWYQKSGLMEEVVVIVLVPCSKLIWKFTYLCLCLHRHPIVTSLPVSQFFHGFS